jgi:hypothetical protein
MRRLFLLVLLVGLLLSDAGASANITEISVTSARDLGTFGGKPYREARLQLTGTAAGGAYSVPALLAYPSRRSDANGFGLVDPYNTVLYAFPEFPGGPVLNREAQRFLGDEYVFGGGNVYIAVLWDKTVLAQRGEGFLADGLDAFDVLRDSSALVRWPGSMPYPRRFKRPPAAAKVVAFGYSQSANLLRNFYVNHQNTKKGLAFDGALLGGSGSTCMSPVDVTVFYVCEGTLADGGKVQVVNTQADVEFAGFLERGRTAGYRVFELAGVTHIPVPIFDLRPHVNPDQNPISSSPALRAAHRNLLWWIEGAPPPAAPSIRLRAVEPVDIGGFPYVPSVHDSDGNAVGGLRLPHMTSVSHARPAGAPLGTYEGLNFSTEDPFLFISGAFFPFPPARLNELYPTHEVYVERVTRAADRLLRSRHILEADRDAYVSAAMHAEVP